MTNGTLQLDTLNEQNLQVMLAYAAQSTAARAAAKAVAKAVEGELAEEDGFDGWLERLSSLSGFTSEQLTQQHGQLIALGFLKFEIAGRSVGLRYQISPRGKQAMERALAKSAGCPDNASESEDSEELPTQASNPTPGPTPAAVPSHDSQGYPEVIADAA